MNLSLSAMSIVLPKLARHPNRLPFRGVLTLLDVPSDRAPAGARGHRVLLTRSAADAALPSLLGMALDYTPTLDGHDARRKIGIITSADIAARTSTRSRDRACPVSPNVGSQIAVAGYLFARDFPEVVREMQANASSVVGCRSSAPYTHFEERLSRAAGRRDLSVVEGDEEFLSSRCSLGEMPVPRPARDLTSRHDSTVHLHASNPQPKTGDRQLATTRQRPTTTDQRPLLGMSYEIADVRVEDVRAEVWILTEVIFTGAAVLRRDKAAYHNTWIALGA